MAKKKKGSAKGKKSKTANMTEEERLVYMEQQAQQAAEASKKKIELATAYLKEKLAQEEANARINLRKLNAQWVPILRQAKAKELQKEIEILSQTFERVVDRKNAVIENLVQDLKESEQQEAMATRSHLLQTDKLIDFQHATIEQLHGEFNGELRELQDEFMKERDGVIAQHEREMNDIKDILFAMKMLFEDQENELVQEFSSRRDDLRTQNLEARSTLKASLEHIINELWEQFQQAQQQYEQGTAEKRGEFERLRDKDRQSAITIEQQMRKLQRINDQMQACKQHLATTQRDTEEANKALKQEKSDVLMHFQQLKTQMARSRERERESLKRLTVVSRSTAAKLEERVARAEKLLKTAEMCRKLETEEEKVLPFYADSVTTEEVEDLTGEAATPAPEALPAPTQPFATAYTPDNRPVEEHAVLDGFWKRYNKALLDKLAVEREQAALEAENEQLRSVLKQYLDGISVGEDTLQQANTLLVVTQSMASVPVGDSRVQRAQGATVEVQAGRDKQRIRDQ
eukprot:m.76460 g.76460  ORF g.76460 m.76460 type:complete len:517 (+) comp14511_c1_seq3:33-1583(+)